MRCGCCGILEILDITYEEQMENIVACIEAAVPIIEKENITLLLEPLNDFENPFSNETAIFRLSGGGVLRINEFRRVGINKSYTY